MTPIKDEKGAGSNPNLKGKAKAQVRLGSIKSTETNASTTRSDRNLQTASNTGDTKPSSSSSLIGNLPKPSSSEVFTHGGVRKTKFTPVVPARRTNKRVQTNEEKKEDNENLVSSELKKLYQLSQEHGGNLRGLKTFNKNASGGKVAFGFGSTAFSAPSREGKVIVAIKKEKEEREKDDKEAVQGKKKEERGKEEKEFMNSNKDEMKTEGGFEQIHFEEKIKKVKKKEEMDYTRYYPTSLPLKEPYSDDYLEDEFSEEAKQKPFDENVLSSAEELKLMKESPGDRLLFFQLPDLLPLESFNDQLKISQSNESQGQNQSQSQSQNQSQSQGFSLNKLPSGSIGKLVVYQSGAVKLRMGPVVMEVVPGAKCVFHQEIAAVNTSEKKCYFLGDVNQRVVVVPDIDNVLESTAI